MTTKSGAGFGFAAVRRLGSEVADSAGSGEGFC